VSEYLLLFLSACVTRVVNAMGALRGSSAPERILIVKVDHLGDVVLATPAIRALRLARPDVPIDVLAASESQPALEANPGIARVLTYDSRRYQRAPVGPPRANFPGPRPVDVMREITRTRYTTIVELRGDAWTLLLPFGAGSRRRLDRGSLRMREWIRRRLPGGSKRPRLHEVETNLEIIRPLLPRETPLGDLRLEIQVHPDRLESMRRKLEVAGVDPRKDLILIHPAAAWGPKVWPPERFAAVADWIEEHYDGQVLFVGSADERDMEAEVRKHARGTRAFWLAGSLTLREVTALLSTARLCIDNDTGLAHVAAALGVPSIVLFGPGLPERFRPWSDRTVVLHHRAPCCPCEQVRCVRPERPCVTDITVAEVVSQVAVVLGHPRAASPAPHTARAAG